MTVALARNEREAFASGPLSFLGSWRPAGEGLAYISFVPNLSHASRLLPSLVVEAAQRAREQFA